MSLRIPLFCLLMTFLGGQVVRGQDEVYLRGKEKPAKVNIKAETALGVEPDAGKGKTAEIIPAEEILDILYNITPDAVRVTVYRPTFLKEKKYLDPLAKRDSKEKVTLAEIIKGYAEVHGQVKEKFAKRHLEYKLAYLSLLQAQEEGGDITQVMEKLSNFKTKHADTWQLAACLRLLGNLQVGQKKYDEAVATYQELAAAPVSPEVKLEAEVSAAQVGLRSGKGSEALKKLNDILAKLPKDSKFHGRARIAKAESLAAAKDKDKAIALLREIIKDANDKSVKAAAYNALGEIYFKADAYKEARWEFLWVDVVYNQDKNEHARALYYLAQIFDKLGEPERAKECRDTLVADRQFAGMEWQRLAIQSAVKTP